MSASVPQAAEVLDVRVCPLVGCRRFLPRLAFLVQLAPAAPLTLAYLPRDCARRAERLAMQHFGRLRRYNLPRWRHEFAVFLFGPEVVLLREGRLVFHSSGYWVCCEGIQQMIWPQESTSRWCNHHDGPTGRQRWHGTTAWYEYRASDAGLRLRNNSSFS